MNAKAFVIRMAIGIALVSGTACSEGSTSTDESTPILVTISGNAQTGEAGEPLGSPIMVRVRDEAYEPVADAAVTFAVTQGGGSVAQATVRTNAQGLAATTWTLGALHTGEQVLTARLGTSGDAGVQFVATATPARLRITKTAGDSQTGMVRGALPTPLTVEVRDAAGNPVPGVDVGWTITQTPLAGSGTLTSAMTRTDATGRATVSYSLPYRAGPTVVTAKVMQPNGREVRFHATVTPAPPARIVALSSATTIFPGTTVVDSVRVLDIFDEPAVNVPVRWTVYDAAGGSTVINSFTNDLGVARNTRTASNAVANQVLRTEVSVAEPGVAPVVLLRTVAAVMTIGIVSGDNQVGVVGQPLPLPMVVLVSDALGNPMSGVNVTWTPVEYWGGAAQATATTTDAAGRASYTFFFANQDYYYVVAQIPEVDNLSVWFFVRLSGP